MQGETVIVIGAGIIGLSTALQLQARGFSVRVLDRKGVAAEASKGNAGAFAFTDIEPLATPGIMTGSIIGMAQALGETAPLLMIGMVAFIVDLPTSPTDPSTVLPVQIYIWADSPERAFVERTSAGIMVLLGFLITMNLTAVMIRKRLERQW